MVYAAYGLAFSTAEEFPELPRVERPADYDVHWNRTPAPPRAGLWSVVWRSESGEPWATIARAPDAYYVRFPRFMAVRAGRTAIDVGRRGHVAPATLRHLFLDQALPLVLAAHGHVVVHASAVLLNGTAVLLAGPAGAGKSTLAAQLSRLGLPVLADDGVLVQDTAEGLRVAPSYGGLRLFDDSAAVSGYGRSAGLPLAEYTPKRRFVPLSGPAPVRPAIPAGPMYLLDAQPGEVRFTRLSRRDTTVALLQHAYRADLTDRLALRTQLERLAEWAGRLDAWKVSFRRRLEESDMVAARILAHAAGQV